MMYCRSATANAEVEYPCLSGERRHLPCINFKDSACPAELPRWLSWLSGLPGKQNGAGSSPAQGSSSLSLGKKSCLRASLLAFALSP